MEEEKAFRLKVFLWDQFVRPLRAVINIYNLKLLAMAFVFFSVIIFKSTLLFTISFSISVIFIVYEIYQYYKSGEFMANYRNQKYPEYRKAIKTVKKQKEEAEKDLNTLNSLNKNDGEKIE